MPETTTGGAIARVEIPYNEYFSQFYFVHSAPKGRRVSLPDSAINKENTEIFKQNLSELAKMPQEAYDDLADTIFHLSSHSYGFDSEDSGSILFSEDGKKLIVKNPKYSQDEKAPASNTLCTLLGGEYAINYFKTQGTKDKQNRPTDNELRDNINTVAIKYIDALGKKGYDFEKTKRLDKLLQTGILDEITNSSKSYPNFRLGNLKHLLKN